MKKNFIKEAFKLIFLNIDLIISLYLYAFLYCKPRKYAFNRVSEIIKYMSIYKCFLKMKWEKELIVFDQGIIQYIWSLCFFDSRCMKKNLLLKYILFRIENNYSIYYFYYKVDYKLAAKRASTRESGCPIDKLGYSKILELYNNHYQDYNILLNYVKKVRTFVVNDEYDLQKKIIFLKEQHRKNEK